MQKAESIAPCGSTRINENFNHMVATKAPKSRHYSSSGSLKTRVSSAVATKNVGSGYLSDAYSKTGVSPGKFYQKHAASLDKKRKRETIYKTSQAYKRRKLLFSSDKTQQQESSELREGTTYMRNIAFAADDNDITKIPPPAENPVYLPIDCSNTTFVYFDIEPTSLAKQCSIIQLAATDGKSKQFSSFIAPEEDISPATQKLTGITYDNSIGSMMYCGKTVKSATLPATLENFINWLEPMKPVVLVAHNCLMNELKDVVMGFADTLPFFRKNHEFSNYKQETIVTELLGRDYNAHNVVHDAEMLSKVCDRSQHKEQLKMFTFSVTDTLIGIEAHERLCSNLPSLQILVDEKIISKSMAKKIAKSGIQMLHMKLAYERQGENGLRYVRYELGSECRTEISQGIKIFYKRCPIISMLLSNMEPPAI